MDSGFDRLTWFDGLAQLILGNPSIFFLFNYQTFTTRIQGLTS